MKSAPLPFLLYILLAPALAVAADGAGVGAARMPLDLSLSREALAEVWTPPSAGNAMPLPDLGGSRMDHSSVARRGGGRGDLPYGAGYEARQSTGGGAGGGHGRGRGRGR